MDATNCYLFFQRLASKVDLINAVVAQTHNLPESLNGPVSDVLGGQGAYGGTGAGVGGHVGVMPQGVEKSNATETTGQRGVLCRRYHTKETGNMSLHVHILH